MKWDESFSKRADPSGRSAGVHDSAYDDHFEADTKLTGDEPPSKKAKN
jgi:asparagine synthase (glutamine-hydrolysing)